MSRGAEEWSSPKGWEELVNHAAEEVGGRREGVRHAMVSIDGWDEKPYEPMGRACLMFCPGNTIRLSIERYQICRSLIRYRDRDCTAIYTAGFSAAMPEFLCRIATLNSHFSLLGPSLFVFFVCFWFFFCFVFL